MSVPGHLFGPPPMRLSTPGHVPGSPAGSTTAWGQIHNHPLINLSTPGPAPGSTMGLMTSVPGHILGPQNTSVQTQGIPAVPKTESSTGPAPGASSGSGLGSAKNDDFLGSDRGTNDAKRMLTTWKWKQIARMFRTDRKVG